MIIQQRCNPGSETEFAGVMFETILEDCFRLLVSEQRLANSATSGNEINLIVDLPMFETVLPSVF